MRKHLLVMILILACTINTFAEINIIPKPVKMETETGFFTLNDASDYHYRVPLPIAEEPVKTSDGYTITLATPVSRAQIRYTTDGSYPTAYSPIYTMPITVKYPQKFTAITVVDMSHFSLAFKFPEDDSK